jgi:hypothetical protein
MRTVKREGGSSQRSKSSARKFLCYYCDDEGHLKRNCPKRKNDKNDEKSPVSTVAEGSIHASDNDLFLATTVSLGKSDWILDSSYSFHMCSVKQHFDTYQACVIWVLSRWQMVYEAGLPEWEQYDFACLMEWCGH